MSAKPISIDVTEEAKTRAALRIRNTLGLGANTLYDATQPTTNRRVIPLNTGDSKRTINRYTRMQALSLARWAYANEGFTKGAVDAMALYSISDGFTPIAQDTPDPTLTDPKEKKKAHAVAEANNAAHEDYFNQTAKVLNVNGSSLWEDVDLASKAIDVDGGLGFLLCETDDGFPQYQIWEAHRIGTGRGNAEASANSFTAKTPDGNTVTVQGTIYDGVTIDAVGRPVGYRLLTDDFGGFTDVPAWNFIYLGERNRTDETQCISNLVHALPDIQDMREIIILSKQMVKASSVPGLVITGGDPDDSLGGHAPRFGESLPGEGVEEHDDIVKREELYGGMIPRIPAGSTLQSHSPSIPCPALPQFNEVLCRPTALGMGLPLQFVYKPEDMKAASSRLITSQAKRRFRKRQNLIITRLINRLYFWVISKGIKLGVIPQTKTPWKVAWQLPQDITVDANRDSQQNRADIWAGNRTLQEDAAERNMNWKKIKRQKAIEAAYDYELAEEFQVPVERISTISANPTHDVPKVDEEEPNPTESAAPSGI